MCVAPTLLLSLALLSTCLAGSVPNVPSQQGKPRQLTQTLLVCSDPLKVQVGGECVDASLSPPPSPTPPPPSSPPVSPPPPPSPSLPPSPSPPVIPPAPQSPSPPPPPSLPESPLPLPSPPTLPPSPSPPGTNKDQMPMPPSPPSKAADQGASTPDAPMPPSPTPPTAAGQGASSPDIPMPPSPPTPTAASQGTSSPDAPVPPSPTQPSTADQGATTPDTPMPPSPPLSTAGEQGTSTPDAPMPPPPTPPTAAGQGASSPDAPVPPSPPPGASSPDAPVPPFPPSTAAGLETPSPDAPMPPSPPQASTAADLGASSPDAPVPPFPPSTAELEASSPDTPAPPSPTQLSTAAEQGAPTPVAPMPPSPPTAQEQETTADAPMPPSPPLPSTRVEDQGATAPDTPMPPSPPESFGAGGLQQEDGFEPATPPPSLPMASPPVPLFALGETGQNISTAYPPFYPSLTPMPLPMSPSFPSPAAGQPLVFMADPAKYSLFGARISMRYDDLSSLPYSGQGITYSHTGYTLRANYSSTARDTFAHCAFSAIQTQRLEISQALEIDVGRISITCAGMKGASAKPTTSSLMSADGQSEASQISKGRQMLQEEGSCSPSAQFRATFSLPPKDSDWFVQRLNDWNRKQATAAGCQKPDMSFKFNTLVAVEVDGDFDCSDFVKEAEAQKILEASSITCGDFFGVGEAIQISDDDGGRGAPAAPPQPSNGDVAGAGVTVERVEQSDWMDTGKPFLWVWVLIAAVGLLLWCCLPCFLVLLFRWRQTSKKAKLVSTGTNTAPRSSRYDNEVFCTNEEDIFCTTNHDDTKGSDKANGDPACIPSFSAGGCVGPAAAQSSFARPGSAMSSFSLSIPAQGSFIGPQRSFYIPRGESHPGSPELAQQSHWLRTPPDSPCENALFQPSSYTRSSHMTEVSEHHEHDHDVSERSSPGGSPHTVVHFADESYSELPAQWTDPGLEGCTLLDTKPSQAGRASASIEPSDRLAKIDEPLESSHLQEPAAEEAVAEDCEGEEPQQAPEQHGLATKCDGPSSERPGLKLPLIGRPLLRAAQSFRTTFGSRISHSTEQEGDSLPRRVLRSLSATASQSKSVHLLRTGSSKTSQVQPDPASTIPAEATPSRTSNTSSDSRTSAAKGSLKSQATHWLMMGSCKSSQVQPDPAFNAPSEVAHTRTSNTSSCSRNRYMQAAGGCPTSPNTGSWAHRASNPAAKPHPALASGAGALLALRPTPAGQGGLYSAGGTRRAASCTMPSVAGSPRLGRTIFGVGSFSAPRDDFPGGGAASDLALGAGGGGDPAAGVEPRSRSCWKTASQNEIYVPKEEDTGGDRSQDSLPRPLPLPAGLETSAEPLLPIKLFAPALTMGTRPPEIIPGTPEQTEPTQPEGQAREPLFHKRRFSQLAAAPRDAQHQPSLRHKSFTYGSLGQGPM